MTPILSGAGAWACATAIKAAVVSPTAAAIRPPSRAMFVVFMRDLPL
jgi:hypothetical protein